MRKLNSEKGSSAVEFALILPVLVLILFGTVEFSLLLFDKQVITNASREGARAGIVAPDPRPDDSSIKAVVNNYCLNHLVTFGAATPPEIDVERTYPEDTGKDLKVTVRYRYRFLIVPHLLVGLVSGSDDLVLTAQAVMKYE